MDQQHQNPLLLKLFAEIVGAWPSAYFTSRHLCSKFMFRILLSQAFRMCSCLWYLPGTKKSRRAISWLAYLVAGFHYETDKPETSRPTVGSANSMRDLRCFLQRTSHKYPCQLPKHRPSFLSLQTT